MALMMSSASQTVTWTLNFGVEGLQNGPGDVKCIPESHLDFFSSREGLQTHPG